MTYLMIYLLALATTTGVGLFIAQSIANRIADLIERRQRDIACHRPHLVDPHRKMPGGPVTSR